MYHAELGRFAKRDSIGYEDGDNLASYTANNPVAYHDPNGTIRITGEKGLGWNCPKSDPSTIFDPDPSTGRWMFKIWLHGVAPCDGYIVQEVLVFCTLCQCDPCCDLSSAKSDLFVFYEIFPVKAGKDKDTLWGEDNSDHTIDFSKCGARLVIATLKFYCENPNDPAANGVGTGDLSGWPMNKLHPSRDQVCGGKWSRNLQSTDNPADVSHFWGAPPVASEPPAVRVTGVVFNCCQGSDFVYPIGGWSDYRDGNIIRFLK